MKLEDFALGLSILAIPFCGTRLLETVTALASVPAPLKELHKPR